MKTVVKNLLLSNGLGLLIISFALACATMAAASGEPVIFKGDKMVPGIWVDPDGCEHWVMDDGWEGFMTPHVTRDGRPVCRSGNTCAVLASDHLFASNQYLVSATGKARIEKAFQDVQAKSFIVAGHTDSRASDDYNMKLSLRRAQEVAKIAQGVGAEISFIRGYGERLPKATNNTAWGRKKNRRVEIICVH